MKTNLFKLKSILCSGLVFLMMASCMDEEPEIKTTSEAKSSGNGSSNFVIIPTAHSVTGYVTGSVDNETIPGAVITLFGPSYKVVVADQNGYYFANNLEAGAYQVTITAHGYETYMPIGTSKVIIASFESSQIANLSMVPADPMEAAKFVQGSVKHFYGPTVPNARVEFYQSINGSTIRFNTFSDANGNYSMNLPLSGSYYSFATIFGYASEIPNPITEVSTGTAIRNFVLLPI